MINSQGSSCSSCQEVSSKANQWSLTYCPFLQYPLHLTAHQTSLFTTSLSDTDTLSFSSEGLHPAIEGSLRWAFCYTPGISKVPHSANTSRGLYAQTAGIHLSPAGPHLYVFIAVGQVITLSEGSSAVKSPGTHLPGHRSHKKSQSMRKYYYTPCGDRYNH